MKNVLIINLSPRRKGTSVVLAHRCEEFLSSKGHRVTLMHLYPNPDDLQELYKAFDEADTAVLSGPCYVNTYPADTVALLEGLLDHAEVLHGQKLYGMIQGGMPTVHTHESGLNMLEMFARKCDVHYNGGFVMGLGAMLDGQPLDKLLNAGIVKRQLMIFFGHIEKGEASPPEVYRSAQLRLPGFVNRLMAAWLNWMFDREMKKNGIDIHQPSPYLEM